MGAVERNLSQPDSRESDGPGLAMQWIANYAVSWTFPILDQNPYLVEHFKHGFTYWLYGVMSILAALFMWAMVPETKGRSLEQMELVWRSSVDKATYAS